MVTNSHGEKPRYGFLSRLAFRRGDQQHSNHPSDTTDETRPDEPADDAEPHLLPHHQARIDASGISPEVARARGYRSVEDPEELTALGFADYQCRTPGLLVPIHDALSRIATYQLRPDKPRTKDGKPLKYETPSGTRMVVDVPPAVLPVLGDHTVPLIITEGARKADAAVSRGLACIGLLGVHNFRGKDEHGAKHRLSCWQEIALNDRTVYICYDNDVMEKSAVYSALVELKSFLEYRGSIVKIIYLPTDTGEKIGLDDYLAAGHSVEEPLALATDELRPPPGESVTAPEWETPIPLTHVDRPPFPVETLPEWLGSFVRETGRWLQVPLDLIALLVLAAVATACARKVRLVVRGSWSVPLNVYSMVALPPGERKSHAFDTVMAPIAQFERDEADRL